MKLSLLLLCSTCVLQGIPEPASVVDRNFVTKALKAFESYDKEAIGFYTSSRNSNFSDLRPYYGWFTYGADPERILFLGHASQRKRYLHVECGIRNDISPERSWNNYLMELQELDGKTYLSKIGIPGKGIPIKNSKATPKEIAEAHYRSQETNSDASTRIDLLCQEKLCDSVEMKAHRCSLVVNRFVHDLRIPTYVDAVAYLIQHDDGYTGYVVHLSDYEMARIKSTDATP